MERGGATFHNDLTKNLKCLLYTQKSLKLFYCIGRLKWNLSFLDLTSSGSPLTYIICHQVVMSKTLLCSYSFPPKSQRMCKCEWVWFCEWKFTFYLNRQKENHHVWKVYLLLMNPIIMFSDTYHQVGAVLHVEL